jgi:MoaA/NifB/PqqE/SkfB family radical SAM enzyme
MNIDINDYYSRLADQYVAKISTKDRVLNNSFDPEYIKSILRKVFKTTSQNGEVFNYYFKTLETFMNNFSEQSVLKRKKYLKSHSLAPETYVLGITDDCNLNCKYCYSHSGGKKSNYIDIDVALSIISEMYDEFGITYITISGGEPFPYVLEIAERCRDKVFFVYSNGSKIDRSVAKRIKELGNIVPALSMVGPKEIHDEIRGDRSFDLMMQGVQNLQDESVLWGFSITESKANYKQIINGDIFDYCSKFSPYIVRLIPYVSEGRELDDYKLSANERLEVGLRIKEFQQKYDFVIYDYVSDKALGIDCMAGGLRYFYISPTMKLTPCVFMDAGEKISYDPRTKKSNVLNILKHNSILKKTRSLAFKCDGCILQEMPKWHLAVN